MHPRSLTLKEIDFIIVKLDEKQPMTTKIRKQLIESLKDILIIPDAIDQLISNLLEIIHLIDDGPGM